MAEVFSFSLDRKTRENVINAIWTFKICSNNEHQWNTCVGLRYYSSRTPLKWLKCTLMSQWLSQGWIFFRRFLSWEATSCIATWLPIVVNWMKHTLITWLPPAVFVPVLVFFFLYTYLISSSLRIDDRKRDICSRRLSEPMSSKAVLRLKMVRLRPNNYPSIPRLIRYVMTNSVN